MTDELKPVRCGCGGEASADWDTENGYYLAWVRCPKCKVQTAKYYDRHDEKKVIEYAVKAWNRAMGERTAKVKVLYRDESVIFGHCECGQAVNTYGTYCHKCGARLEWE